MVAALVGVLCFVIALLEFDLILARNLALPFWAANAIVLTALLRMPRSAWPAIIAAAGVGLFAADIVAHRPVAIGVVYTLANLCEISVAALLLRRGGRPFELSERGEVTLFIVVCGLVAPFVSASIASIASFVQPGGFSLLRALSWFAANALGLITFTPALWLSAGAHRAIGRDPRRIAALSALILVMAPIWVATAYLPGYSVPFLCFPILAYTALEFGVAGIALAILASSLFSFGAAILTLYIRAPNVPIADLLYRLEVFVAGEAIFALPLGVIVDDKKRIQDALINCMAISVNAQKKPLETLRPDEIAITAGLLGQDGVFRLIARDGAPEPSIEGLDGVSLYELMPARDRRRLEAAFDNAVSHEERDASRRLHVKLDLSGQSTPVTLTLLSVRRGIAGQTSEAMLLIETAARLSAATARAA